MLSIWWIKLGVNNHWMQKAVNVEDKSQKNIKFKIRDPKEKKKNQVVNNRTCRNR